MKNYSFKMVFTGMLAVLLCAIELHAQQRGGFGGFGGFGGLGAGGAANRAGGSQSTMAGQYNNNGSIGSAVITVDPQTHNIVVIADEETSQQISNILASLDAPKPQVLIKVVFMEVQRNNDLDIGIEGAYVPSGGLGNGNLAASAANVFGLAGANTVVTNFAGMGLPLNAPGLTTPAGGPVMPGSLSPGSGGPNGFYQIMGKDFQATLKAIAQAGKAQVLSRPSILARDGQLAKIVVGQSIYMPSGVSYTSVGNNTTPIINGTYTSVGIILNVTPFIGQNNLVEMILQPQTSVVDTSTLGQQIASGGGILGGSAVYAPTLNVRSADTVVVTPDAQTVVIGGLISNNKSSSDNKVPLLGDIPLLGMLFKSSAKSDTKTELLMFLTPHIVKSPTMLAAMAVNETSQASAITNSVSELELNRFLERVPVKRN